MPEENEHEIHSMMNQKIIGSSTYKVTDDKDKEEPDYMDQANYLIAHGYFTDVDEMSVSDLAEKLKQERAANARIIEEKDAALQLQLKN